MQSRRTVLPAVLVFFLSSFAAAQAQQAPASSYGLPYGGSIGLDAAKKAAAVALAEAARNNWTMAVAVVDPSGNLVYYEKMDNTQLGSAHVAVDKARSAGALQAAHEGVSGRTRGRRQRVACSWP